MLAHVNTCPCCNGAAAKSESVNVCIQYIYVITDVDELINRQLSKFSLSILTKLKHFNGCEWKVEQEIFP